MKLHKGKRFVGRKESWVLKDEGQANMAKMKELKQGS